MKKRKKSGKAAIRSTKAASARSARIDVSAALKRQAEKQKIRVELTDEQAEALFGVWNDLNPKKPAQVTFVVKGRPVTEFAVAAYRYRGDTCCV